MGIKFPCLSCCSSARLSNCIGSFSLSSPSSSVSTSFSLPIFFGPLVTLVNVKGEALGHVYSSSESPSAPPRIHSLVIVTGWGINPL